MEDPIRYDPNPLPVPPLDPAHLNSADFFSTTTSAVANAAAFDAIDDDQDDDFLLNLDFDFSVDDLTFADGFLIEPDNPNSSLSNGSENPNLEISEGFSNPNPNLTPFEGSGNPNLEISEGFSNPNPNFEDSLSPEGNHGPISSEESNFGPGGSGCGETGNLSDRDVSSDLSENSKVKEEVKCDDSKKLSKRKKDLDSDLIEDVRINKVKRSGTMAMENSSASLGNDCGNDDDDKRRARLMRNRESAQLSRQRKKQYVEELEDKVRTMHSTITELNGKISYMMAENASLRQQLTGGGAGGATPPPPPVMGMYPMAPMPYPWMPYSPYMVKPQGSQVPLVPIPRLKPQQPAAAPKSSKKSEGKKSEGKGTKKVASVSLLGLLFCMLLFGGLVPMVNVKYGGFGNEGKGGMFMVDKTVGVVSDGKFSSPHGRILQQSNRTDGNSSEPMVASLYVPRNDKLVKIDGNLIIHSVLASEKAKASKVDEGGTVSEETGLAIHGSYPPYPTPGPGSDGWRHPHLDRNQKGRQRALGSSSSSEFTPVGSDGKLQQWFREGLAGPMLSSGMCTEVFQFDISPTPGAIVPATSVSNVTSKERQNSTRTNKPLNRRILHEHAIPLDGHSLNTTEIPQEHNDGLQGNKSSSSMVVSVLVDPREAGDGDGEGVIRSKTMSRIFVVVLIDSVKYVTYSCMLPFVGSGNHLVTT